MRLKLSRREEEFNKIIDPYVAMTCEDLMNYFTTVCSESDTERLRDDPLVLKGIDALLDKCHDNIRFLLTESINDDDNEVFYLIIRGLMERRDAYLFDVNFLVSRVCAKSAYKCFKELLSILEGDLSFLYVTIEYYSTDCTFIRKCTDLLMERGVPLRARIFEASNGAWFLQQFLIKLINCYESVTPIISLLRSSEGISLPLNFFSLLVMESDVIKDETRITVDDFNSLLSYYKGSYDELYRSLGTYLKENGRSDLIAVLQERM